jgi:hypothetical protein
MYATTAMTAPRLFEVRSFRIEFQGFGNGYPFVDTGFSVLVVFVGVIGVAVVLRLAAEPLDVSIPEVL